MGIDPDDIHGLDDLAEVLLRARAAAGSPSFARLAAGVRALRLARGRTEAEAAVGRVTIYDCFRPGRRRVDEDLVCDLLAVLGEPEESLAGWRRAVRHAQSAPGTPAAPQQAPAVRPLAPTGETVGREHEMELLIAALAGPEPSAITLVGLGGIGKSHLARSAVSTVAARTGRPTLEVDLRGHAAIGSPVRGPEVVSALLGHLGISTQDDPLDALHAAAARSGLLLVLDDARDLDQVLPLVPRTGDWHLVVTARRDLEVPGRSVLVGPLTPEATAELLRREAPQHADMPGWEALAEMTGGVPIVARLLARRLAGLAGWSPSDLVEATRGGAIGDISEVIGLTVTGLDAEVLRVLHHVCLHPSPEVEAPAVAALLDDDVTRTRSGLRALHEHHLIDPVGPDRWRLHDLVWQTGLAAARESRRPKDLAAARTRLLQHYLDETVRHVVTIYPPARGALPWWSGTHPVPSTPEDSTAWLTANAAAVQAALATAHPQDDMLTMHLAEALAWHLVTHSASQAMLTVGLLARDAAARSGDLADRARTERLMGNAYARLSRIRDADLSYRASRDLAAAAGDVDAEIAAVANLARIASADGDQDRACELLELARAHYVQVGDAARESLCTTNLIVTHTRAGRITTAGDLAIAAAAQARTNGWASRELMALSNSIEPLLAAGRLEVAAQHAAREAELAADLDDEVVAVYAVLHQAMVRLAQGAAPEAYAMAREALARNGDVEDALQRSQVLNQCGLAATACGDPDAARGHHEEALTLALSIGEATEAERARAAMG